MDQTQKANRGLRYLCLEQYLNEEGELLKANIIKLQILNSLNSETVYQPIICGYPHDGAVRVPRDAINHERLIWFDFMVLLDDESGTASRFGTVTIDAWVGASPPAFYVVVFPKAPEYVAIVPHDAAWRDREGVYSLVSVPGPYLPYLLPVHQVSEALGKISTISQGLAYTNPGTKVTLGAWVPVMEESVNPTPPLQVLDSQPHIPPSLTSARHKRSREDSDEGSVRLPPALRESTSSAPMPSSGIPDLEIDALLTEQDLLGLDWQSLWEDVAQGGLDGKGAPDDRLYIQPAVYQQTPVANAGTGNVGHQPDYINSALPESWALFEGIVEPTRIASLSPIDRDAAEGLWSFPSTEVAPATPTVAAAQPNRQALLGRHSPHLRALAPALSPVEAVVVRPASAAKPTTSPLPVASPPEMAVPSPNSSPVEDTAEPPCLIELHTYHPWCNHMYIPPSTIPPLANLFNPETLCLPILTSFTHLPNNIPTPLSRLYTSHPCLHILTNPNDPSTITLLESRIVSAYRSRLTAQLNSATTTASKKSGLRGRNKRRTENPTIVDLVLEYGLRSFEVQSLGERVRDFFGREQRRRLGGGEIRAVCCVREVLQAQVDGLFGDGTGRA